jgi:hypothetical protein
MLAEEKFSDPDLIASLQSLTSNAGGLVTANLRPSGAAKMVSAASQYG